MRSAALFSICLSFAATTAHAAAAAPRPRDAALGPQLVVQGAARTHGLSFSPDGRLLFTEYEGLAQVWDVAAGKLLTTLREGIHHLSSASFDASGRLLGILGQNQDGPTMAYVVDLRTGVKRDFKPAIENEWFSGHGLALTPDGASLYTTRLDDKYAWWLAVRDVRTGAVRGRFSGKQIGAGVTFSDDGAMWIRSDQGFRQIDPKTGKELRLLAQSADSISRTPDFRFFAVHMGSKIEVRDASGKEPVRVVKLPSDTFQGLELSPDGKILTAIVHQGPFSHSSTIDRFSVADGSRLSSIPLDAADDAINGLSFAPGAALLAYGTDAGGIRIIEAATGALVRTLGAGKAPGGSVAFSPDGRTIITGRETWDLATARSLPAGAPGATQEFGALSPDGKLLASSTTEGLRIIDLATGAARPLSPNPYKGMAFIRGGSVVAAARVLGGGEGWKGELALFDVASGKRLAETGAYNDLVPSPDGTRLLAVSKETVDVLDASSLKVLAHRGDVFTSAEVAWSRDGKRFVYSRYNSGFWVSVCDLASAQDSDKTLYLSVGSVGAVAFTQDGNSVLLGGDDGLTQWSPLKDVEHKKQGYTDRSLTRLEGPVGIHAFAVSPDGKLLATATAEGETLLRDYATLKPLASLIGGPGGSYVIALADGHYTASRAALGRVAFRVGEHAYGFEQFDLKLNRPDLVLQALGKASPALIETYRKAYLRRLVKLGFDESKLAGQSDPPEVALALAEIPRSTGEAQLELAVKASASAPLDRLDIYVNGVPLGGSRGFDLREKAAQKLSVPVAIPLSRGKNTIEISALDQRGVASLAQTIEVVRTAPSAKDDLYVVAIGVSAYQDKEYALRYAAKDASDLAALLEARRGKYAAVHVLRVLDGDATREGIAKATEFLKATQVDDEVIVFLAGHGLLDDKLDYYFGTVDVDFEHPAARGLPYDAIEALLDGVVARKKLLLMDTCNSGEVEKAETTLVASSESASGPIRARGFKLKAAVPLALADSLAVQQALFADLRRGSGAMVISSAGGAEFALESEEWKNGVFTFALLEGMKSGAADANKDGAIRVSELRDYATAKVRELTQGRQTPTSRRENLDLDFDVY
jgi:WD40 repeat protein/uncharacterized caspase-like protein